MLNQHNPPVTLNFQAAILIDDPNPNASFASKTEINPYLVTNKLNKIPFNRFCIS